MSWIPPPAPVPAGERAEVGGRESGCGAGGWRGASNFLSKGSFDLVAGGGEGERLRGCGMGGA